MARGRVELEYAINLVIASCKALTDADLLGWFTPSRILLSTSGEVTIGDADFRPEAIGYMAPEFSEAPVSQIRCREPHIREGNRFAESWTLTVPSAEFEIDRPRAAAFALGCILWELLSGRRLFVGTTDYETLQLARGAQVPPLAGVSPELEAIVRRALAKDVESRYQTPLQFADALAGYLVARASN
jgi:serine/threonine protein kinase